jgi:hypothetical protein
MHGKITRVCSIPNANANQLYLSGQLLEALRAEYMAFGNFRFDPFETTVCLEIEVTKYGDLSILSFALDKEGDNQMVVSNLR